MADTICSQLYISVNVPKLTDISYEIHEKVRKRKILRKFQTKIAKIFRANKLLVETVA